MKDIKKILTFKILGEEYRIKTDMDKDTAIQIANYVDKQIKKISSKAGYASQTKIAVLAALNIAIDLFKEKNNIEHIEKKLEKSYEKIKKALQEN